MPANDIATEAEVKESRPQSTESRGLTDFAQTALKTVESWVDSVKEKTQALVQDGTLPKFQLTDKLDSQPPEAADSSVGRARSKDVPDSEAIKEAKAKACSPESSQQEKLQAATELARLGESTFTGSDGRRYDISREDVGGRTVVSIHTNDQSGHSHAVLRGIVEKDGTISKQRDQDGKEVPYETPWAGKNLKDSPLVGAKEKAEDAPESAERQHLLQTLKDKRLEPPEMTAAERKKLADEHGQLEAKFETTRHQYDALKQQVDARNKPIEAEMAKLDAKMAELEGKQGPATAIGEQNSKVTKALADAGVGDGKNFQTNDPEKFKKAKEEIDQKVGDPDKRAELKAEVDKLQKMWTDSDKIQADIDKLNDKKLKLMDQVEHNKEPLRKPGRELGELGKALNANEEKLQEGKFKEDLKEIDKLPADKREAVYKAMEQIANDSGGPPNQLSADQRQHLVEQLAHQVAHPESIKQGIKGTCGIASTEMELAKNHPEKYAQYLADLATKGETTTPDGRKLKIDPGMINTTDKDGHLVPQDDKNPQRSLASKIFQTAGANMILEDRAAAKTPPETPSKYVSEEPGTNKYPVPIEIGVTTQASTRDFRPSEDTGERIIAPDGTPSQWDGVDHSEIEKLSSTLTGEKYEAQPVVKGRDLKDPEQAAAAQKDFLDIVEKNGLPVKVSITTQKGDFTGMNAEGGHELVITKVDKGPPAMVYYENTAGGADHNYPSGTPVPLDKFLQSMQETHMSDGNTHIEGYIIAKKK